VCKKHDMMMILITSIDFLGIWIDSGSVLFTLVTSTLFITHCQCFMETYTRDLAKAYKNKAYQEKEETCNMKNENQCIL
jgi:hypothetical protein